MRIILLLLLMILTFQVHSQGQRENLNSLNQAAITAYRSKEYKEAIRQYQKMLALDQSLVTASYNLACSAALDGNLELGVVALEKAIDNGYLNKSHMLEDSDLDVIKVSTHWASILERMDGKLKATKNVFLRFSHIANDKIIPFENDGKWGYVHGDNDSILLEAKYANVAPYGGCFVIDISADYRVSMSKEGEYSRYQQPYVMFDERNFDEYYDVVPFKNYQDDKAFEFNENGKILSVSSKYTYLRKEKAPTDEVVYETEEVIRKEQPVEGKTTKVEGVFMDNEEALILIKVGDNPLLINQRGEIHDGFDADFRRLVHIPWLIDDAQWFWYLKNDGKQGFINLQGERKFHGEKFNLYSTYVSKYGLVPTEKDGKHGYIDLRRLEYLLSPQDYKIKSLRFIHTDQCGMYNNFVARKKIVKKLFLIEEGASTFYMDVNGKEFRAY